ncbi:MAG: hypothetical protein JNJ75_04540 [Cyclobacteriaceae bacterium]|nr:hypothetical protein [Cyclobacteriaceae bacterium]
MIVERMTDKEFAVEVVTDYFNEMREYAKRAVIKKGKIKTRHSANYTSKRGNNWFIVYRPEMGGQHSLHVKRLQTGDRFIWYSLVLHPTSITLFGFTKHVGVRLAERYHPGLTPSEALKEMLMKTPAINQAELDDTFYTRVNGGVCLGPVYGKRISVTNSRNQVIWVELRKANTFIADDGLFDDQQKITDQSIIRAIQKLGKNYLTDDDQESLKYPNG